MKGLPVRTLRSVCDIEPVPLGGEVPAGSGAYILLYRGQQKVYGASACCRPIYVGKSVDVSARLCYHMRSLEAARFRPEQFEVVVVPSDPSFSAAVEGYLQDLFRPPWNDSTFAGFGSRDQGATRTSQSPSAWDLLHPGRPWVLANLPNGRKPDQDLRKRMRRRTEEQPHLPLWGGSSPDHRIDPGLLIPLGMTAGLHLAVADDGEIFVIEPATEM